MKHKEEYGIFKRQNGYYYYRYYLPVLDENGEQVYKPLGKNDIGKPQPLLKRIWKSTGKKTRKEALDYVDSISGEIAKLSKNQILIKDFLPKALNHYLQVKALRPQSQDRYRYNTNNLIAYFGEYGLNEISTKLLREYGEISKGNISNLILFYALLGKNLICDKPRFLKSHNDPQYFTLDQFKSFFRYGFSLIGKNDMVYYLAILTCHLTGLRIGEALGLKYEDLYKKGSNYFARISRIQLPDGDIQEEPKTSTSRRIIILPQFLLVYLDFLGSKKEGFIFLNSRRQLIRQTTVREKFIEIQKNLGFQTKLKTHSGRKFFNNILLGEIDGEILKMVMGHSIGEVRSRYTGREEEKLIPIIKVLEDRILDDDDKTKGEKIEWIQG